MTQQKKVFLVEDDESIRESTQQLLESEGYAVESACNGEEGLQMLRSGQALPNLILLDLMMPVKNGWEFRHEQQTDPNLASIPVVIMTADGHAEVKQGQLGVAGYIVKPADIDNILNVVKRCCL